MCTCVRVCVFVCWNPTLQPFGIFALLAAVGAAVCITQSLKLSSCRLCGRDGTTAVAPQVCVGHYLLCVCAMCAMVRVRACRFVQVCAFVCLVLEPHIYFSFLIFRLLLLLPYHAVCISPCLKLSRSLLCGSHGTTAAAQQVCVDHLYAYVGIEYRCVCDGCVCYDAMILETCGTCYYCSCNAQVNNTTWYLVPGSTQQELFLLTTWYYCFI